MDGSIELWCVQIVGKQDQGPCLPPRSCPNVRGPENIDRERGANRSDLSDLFDVRPYLTPKSDIVALMVLTHQTQMHNWITRAGFETRKAIHSDEVMNKALERPYDYRSESAKRRISSVAEDLVSYLLFSEEFKLTSPVEGDAAFRERFARDAARDSKGRSLRDFDLQTRLFKYPCSYMIHSSSFKSLPAPVMEEVLSRLSAALGDPAATPHLSDADRTALREILAETVEGFPPS